MFLPACSISYDMNDVTGWSLSAGFSLTWLAGEAVMSVQDRNMEHDMGGNIPRN